MNDKELLDAVTKSINEEERKNERRIHLARMSIFSLVLIMMSVSRLMLGEALNTRFVLVSLFSALCIGIGILLWRYYQDYRHAALAKYLLVTLDVAFVFILVLIVRYTMSRDIYEMTSDIPAFGHNDGPFDRVFELPDVSRPLVKHHLVHGFTQDMIDRPVGFLGESMQKVFGQEWDVFFAFT